MLTLKLVCCQAIQSAGAAGVSAMDNNHVAYMTMLAVAWALCMASLVFMLPLIHYRIQERECSRTLGARSSKKVPPRVTDPIPLRADSSTLGVIDEHSAEPSIEDTKEKIEA